MGLYTLVVIAAVYGGSTRPVAVEVPNLSYSECTMQINNMKLDSGMTIVSSHCMNQGK